MPCSMRGWGIPPTPSDVNVLVVAAEHRGGR
jgi:hypothetical protein